MGRRLLQQSALGLVGGFLVILSFLLGTGYLPWARPHAASLHGEVLTVAPADSGRLVAVTLGDEAGEENDPAPACIEGI